MLPSHATSPASTRPLGSYDQRTLKGAVEPLADLGDVRVSVTRGRWTVAVEGDGAAVRGFGTGRSLAEAFSSFVYLGS